MSQSISSVLVPSFGLSLGWMTIKILEKASIIKPWSWTEWKTSNAVINVLLATPFWSNYLIGHLRSGVEGTENEKALEAKFKKIYHESIKEFNEIDQQLPMIVKCLLGVKLSQCFQTGCNIVRNFQRGEQYLVDQLDSFGEILKSRLAAQYAKQIERLHQNNQTTEKHLQGVKEINQTMGSMVEGFTPRVEEAEKKIQQFAEKVSAQHQKALQLQNEQNQITPEEMETKMEQIKTKLEGLLERRAENFKEAVETLKDFKAAQEHLKNAAQEEKAAQEIVAATITEFNQEPQ